MNNAESFLNIDDINDASLEKLLIIRRVLITTLVNNARKEKYKGMYLVSLAIFSEFERLTRHITDCKIIKN